MLKIQVTSGSFRFTGRLLDRRGIALATALLISLGILIMAAGVLYVITQSTVMSGAGKRFATAEEAADGAVDLIKDGINQVMWGEPLPTPIPTGNCTSQTYDMAFALLNQDTPCTVTLALPGIGGNFIATVTVMRLYTVSLPGGRIEFARAGGGVSSEAVFYRINSVVTGPNNEMVENTALYRFTG